MDEGKAYAELNRARRKRNAAELVLAETLSRCYPPGAPVTWQTDSLGLAHRHGTVVSCTFHSRTLRVRNEKTGGVSKINVNDVEPPRLATRAK